ncbi:hypothetical protein AB0M36_21535 [Actinoplanes sp. NPDC051346]|uniref:hypothetical protein n=1 Tax=Actinoplanes sp. NPDC051346 TaxID=3155048 RepID=UPI00343970A5
MQLVHPPVDVVLDALRQAATVDAAFAERARQLVEPDVRHIADHLTRARDAGLTLPGDPLVVATAFTTLVPAFAAMWQSGGGPELGRELPDAEAIETLTSFVYAGIGGS